MAKGHSLESLIRKYADRQKKDIDTVAQEVASDWRDAIIQGWPVDTTASRGGWQGPLKVADGHYQLKNEYPYAKTIEYGGYPGVGPKTASLPAEILLGGIAINGGIYPTQRPSAPVRRGKSKMIIELNRRLGINTSR